MCATNCEVMRSQHCNHLITFFFCLRMTDEERKIKRSQPNAKIVSCFHIRFGDAWPGISANCCINLADILELQELAPTLDITFGLFHYHITIIHWNQLKFRHVRPIYSSLVTFSKRPHFTQNWSIIFDDFFYHILFILLRTVSYL